MRRTIITVIKLIESEVMIANILERIDGLIFYHKRPVIFDHSFNE